VTLSDLAALGSFVSGVAVVISLIYLAAQIRQSRKHMAAQISHSRVQSGLEQQRMTIGDPELAELSIRGAQGDPRMSEADQMRFRFLVSNVLMMIEDEFRQYNDGLISEERHNGFVKRFSRAFDLPGYRAMWVLQRDGFEPDFQAYLDPIVDRSRRSPPPPFMDAWRKQVAFELVRPPENEKGPVIMSEIGGGQ